MTEDEMLREIARLKAENDKLDQKNLELNVEWQAKLQKAWEENPAAFKAIPAEELTDN